MHLSLAQIAERNYRRAPGTCKPIEQAISKLQSFPLIILLVLCAAAGTVCQPPTPFPSPARPSPFFSWATIPLAHHGANTSGLYTPDAIAQLSRYQMVTIEKWYTPCASQHPAQGNSSCDVESKMFQTFHRLKALNPNITNILYLNSMMNFDFYNLNAIIEAREAAGEKLLLRDMYGNLVLLCNDGDFYCAVKFFDHSNAAMRQLWVDAVLNATIYGAVDGVFADHASQTLEPGPDGIATLCNGSPQKCFNFTNTFAAVFNAGHSWIVNYTQDQLSRLPGSGPIIDGPYARYAAPACDYRGLRAAVEAGAAGGAPYVIEASGGPLACTPDESCLANFLCAAEKFTYLSCLSSGATLPPFLPEYGFSLGPPTGPPVEAGGLVTRHFTGPLGITTTRVHLGSGVGTVEWAGHPPSPPPPPPPPLPDVCGKVMVDTAVALDDVAMKVVDSADQCCDLCVQNSACVIWCFHGEAGTQHRQCHLHSKDGVVHPLTGATSAFVNRTFFFGLLP